MSNPTYINVKLTMWPGEDDDLLAWFERLPQRGRATAVKRALRQGGADAIAAEIEIDEAETAAALAEMFF